MTSYLIQPIQRLPRYEMLLGAVAKLTEEGHPEKESLMQAQKIMKIINDQVNDNKRHAERKDGVYFMDKRLQDKPSWLVRGVSSSFGHGENLTLRDLSRRF